MKGKHYLFLICYLCYLITRFEEEIIHANDEIKGFKITFDYLLQTLVMTWLAEKFIKMTFLFTWG